MSVHPGLSDRVNRLAEEADKAHPDAWKPNVGETLGGLVTDIRMLNTKFDPVPVVTIENENGIAVAFWLIHTVARNEFHRQRIMPGETVWIRYEGKKEPDGGGPAYDSYTIRVDRRERPFDWDEALGPIPGESPKPAQVADQQLAQRLAAEMPTSPVDDDIPF